MTAGRDFLLITIRSTGTPRLGLPKSWFVFGGLLWLLIALVVWVSR